MRLLSRVLGLEADAKIILLLVRRLCEFGGSQFFGGTEVLHRVGGSDVKDTVGL